MAVHEFEEVAVAIDRLVMLTVLFVEVQLRWLHDFVSGNGDPRESRTEEMR